MSVTLNRVRRGFYADSVALMRISRAVSALPGIEAASLMIGTPSNRDLLSGSGLLDAEGAKAQADDLVIAVRAADRAAADAALAEADKLLAGGQAKAAHGGVTAVRGFGSALAALPDANLALISVPGEFAAAEARRALELGLHVMMFSDNVSVEDEVALKRLAVSKGLLLMGPDCGTALIGGAPVAFANVVPRGDVGLISASGTGLQEVSCLLARAGRGISHGIGVGGRDLSEQVGGLMTLAAFDALEADPATRHIVIISKPPAKGVADRIAARVARSAKPVTLCLLGAGGMTLTSAAEQVMGRPLHEGSLPKAGKRKGWLRGLYSGGTLCNEAQIVLLAAGLEVQSNVPVPGAAETARLDIGAHSLIDLGDDEYTRGRPHPMIDPELRNELLAQTLADPAVAVVLLDVVIGYGAHADPAGLIAQVVESAAPDRPVVVASITGTDADPQGYARQAARLAACGVLVAASNAQAAALAARVVA
ncbi:MAG: acyl-CoA synthetase FdrA [Proteobacteria bacterium]|nr:acyl-CoA synthetase FdrA [Pseudomonadota bacterium]